MALSLTIVDLAKKFLEEPLAGCLREVIGTVLPAEYGPNWLDYYRRDFDEDITTKNITRAENGQKPLAAFPSKIHDIKGFDAQACLKVFAYMDGYPYYDKILTAYHVQNKQDFLHTSRELIAFRNEVYHAGEKNEDSLEALAFERAFTNMKKLVSCFPTVCNRQTGRTYLDELEGMYLEYTIWKNTKEYLFSKYPTLRQYSDDQLLLACKSLNIHADYNNNGQLVFYSHDEAGDVKRIAIAMQRRASVTTQSVQGAAPVPPAAPQPQKKKRNKKLLIVLAALAVVLILFIVLLGSCLSQREQDDTLPDTGVTTEVATTAPALQDTTENVYENDGNRTGNNTAATPDLQSSAEDFAEAANNLMGSVFGAPTTAASANAQSGAQVNNAQGNTQSAAATGGTNQIPQDLRAMVEASDPWPEQISVGQTHISSSIRFIKESNRTTIHAYSENTALATVGADMIVTAHARGVVRIVYVYDWAGSEQTYIVEYTIT